PRAPERPVPALRLRPRPRPSGALSPPCDLAQHRQNALSRVSASCGGGCLSHGAESIGVEALDRFYQTVTGEVVIGDADRGPGGDHRGRVLLLVPAAKRAGD